MSQPKFTLKQFSLSLEIQQVVETGDIMLSSTHQLHYKAIRSFLRVKYDHLSVFLDKETVIHISWPRVRMISSINLLSSLHECKIVRPQFESTQGKEVFLNILRASINARYDLKQLATGIKNKLVANYSTNPTIDWIDQNTKELQLQKTQVCTDLIFYALSLSSPTFRNLLRDQIQFLDYRFVGSFTTDDLDILVRQTSFFKLVKESELGTTSLLKPKLQSGAWLLGQVLSLSQIIQSFQLPLWKQIKSIDESSLQGIRIEAIKLLNTIGLYSIFGITAQAQAKAIIYQFIARKMLNQSQDSKTSIALSVFEIYRLIGRPKTLDVLRKIAFHVFTIYISGMLYQQQWDFNSKGRLKSLLINGMQTLLVKNVSKL